MSVVNYAQKYSQVVDEKLALASIVSPAINNNFDWVGTEAVKVYSGETSALNDYQVSGANRYGNPQELGNSVQTMLLSQDKAFTFTIDRKSYDDTMMTMEAGKSLAREIREVIVPYLDKYALNVIANADASRDITALTKNNAYEIFMNANVRLTDANVPEIGRVAFVRSDYYAKLKLDPAFVKQSDMSQQIALSGLVGECDGVKIILAPTNRMPNGVDLIITHPMACVRPIKLEEYKIHDNAPGISGWLVEGRIRQDAFVLNNKVGCIATHGTAATCGVPVFAPVEDHFDTSVEVSIACPTVGAKVYYTLDGTTPTSSSTEYTAPFTVNATKTVKAIAIKTGYTNSDVASKVYTKN